MVVRSEVKLHTSLLKQYAYHGRVSSPWTSSYKHWCLCMAGANSSKANLLIRHRQYGYQVPNGNTDWGGKNHPVTHLCVLCITYCVLISGIAPHDESDNI